MSSASSSGKVSRWGSGSHTKDGHHILLGEIAELSATRHNGSAISVQPETGTGCWNWWEISNARIVGEACDRWFERQYKKTRDRLICPKEYTLARNNREFQIAIQARMQAAKEAQEQKP
jgi:hypothetical protein